MKRLGIAPTVWLLAAGFVLCAAVNLPGHLSYDSIMQLNEGRRGFYANWHPPMMSWILGVLDAIVPGTALFVILDAALLFAGLAAFYWVSRERARAGLVVLALCLLTPQVLLYQGIVWKDVLFADLAIAGFGALAVAARFWDRPKLRLGGLALGLFLLGVATLVRQNGGVVLPAAVVAIAWLAWRLAPAHRLRAAALYGLCALMGCAIAVVGMHSALALRIRGDTSPTVQFRLLEFYDLIGALKAQPALHLSYFDDDDPALEALMRSDGVRLYTPERNDTLVNSAPLQRAYFDSPEETIPEEWHALIARHTGLYLAVRAEVFRWVVLTPDLRACRPVFSGIDGPAEQMKKLGLKTRFDARDAALGYYAQAFEGSPLWSHAFYLALALLFLVPLLVRREPADIVVAAMLVSTLLFTASFFVISIACDYRYLYFVDLATLAAAFYLALDWRTAYASVRALRPPRREDHEQSA